MIVAYIVLLLTYLGLGFGGLPGLRMNRAAIALTGAALLIALGILNLPSAWKALDPNTLVFLFGIMILNAHLSYAGFFQWVTEGLLRLVRTPLGLLVWITLGAGLLSALFLNDTTAILLTPLVINLTQALELPMTPYLLALAGACNLGSTATLTGNPQNILVGSYSGISYLSFVQALGPVALGGLLIQIALLYALYPAVRSRTPFARIPRFAYRLHRPLLYKGMLIALGLLIAFALGYPLAQGALIAAGLSLLTRRVRSERFFLRVDWELLAMFSGLFMVTEAVARLHLLTPFAPLAHSASGLLWVTALLSNLISNVPAVLLLHHLIPSGATADWFLLAAASTLAGNLTLLGSVANLIVAEAARKEGGQLRFLEHLRFGLPLTLLTLLLAYVWIVGPKL